jgi:hypothetical protein
LGESERVAVEAGNRCELEGHKIQRRFERAQVLRGTA